MLLFNPFLIVSFHLPLILLLHKSFHLNIKIKPKSKTSTNETTVTTMKSTRKYPLSTGKSPVAEVSPGPAEFELNFG